MVNNPYGNNYPDIILLNNNGNPTVTSVNTDESIAFALNNTTKTGITQLCIWPYWRFVVEYKH